MKTLPLSQIVISPNRQRKEFSLEDTHEFSERIQERGLLHAIILRKEGDDFVLVAGERRLRAITNIYDMGGSISHDSQPVPEGEIPYTLFSDLDPLAAEEAELEENVCRKDLTWAEQATAVARLSDLRTKQAVASGAPAPSYSSIAAETKGSDSVFFTDKTRKEIIVSRHLFHPEVAAAKSVKEAFKAVLKLERRAKSVELGELVGKDFSAATHQCINADCLEWLEQAPDASIDVILTDPPYGMGADTFGDSGGIGNVNAHAYSDDEAYHHKLVTNCAFEFYRVAKDQAHLYWFCDIETFFKDRDCFIDEGWEVFRTPLIWHKPQGSRAPWPLYGPQRKWEAILYAVKGKRPVNTMSGDVLYHGPDAQMDHSAQKPVSLYKDLLARSVQPGDTVLDTFCGTGPIFPAAHELLCKAIGIEKDPVSYGKAVARIQELK
jgi:site-specific DNA-methyltransferase (adenine-specific)